MRSLHNSLALDLPYLFPRSTGASLRAANRLLYLDVLLRRHAHDATLWRSSKAHALQLITTLAAPRADASEASSSTAVMPNAASCASTRERYHVMQIICMRKVQCGNLLSVQKECGMLLFYFSLCKLQRLLKKAHNLVMTVLDGGLQWSPAIPFQRHVSVGAE
jgi:hypothetical protein